MTEALRQAVLNNESPEKMIDVANAEGRVSMLKAAMEKVKEGVTSPDEIIEKVMLDR
jgi:type II secretory ATPase GspE/PulE/Tfp pilus assembly ATPase PilB-like protein